MTHCVASDLLQQGLAAHGRREFGDQIANFLPPPGRLNAQFGNGEFCRFDALAQVGALQQESLLVGRWVGHGSACRARLQNRDRLVVCEQPAGTTRERKRADRDDVEPRPIGQAPHGRLVDQPDVRGIAPLASFLGRDEQNPAAGAKVRQMAPNDLDRLVFTHVLEHVGEQQRVEPGLRLSAGDEPGGGVGGEAGRGARVDTVLVVVDTDPVAVDVLQVAADSATDVENETRRQPAQVPAIRSLGIDQPPQAASAPGQALQPMRVRGFGRRCRVCGSHGEQPNVASGYPPSYMGPPAITFAVPYHRNLGYLSEAIDSVRAQTLADWELIVVDDAGPEPAAEVVTAFGDGRIRCVRNAENLGLAGNWNECMRLATTDLVTILHADDRLTRGYAAAVVAAAESHPDAAAVFTDAVIIGPSGERVRSLPDRAKRIIARPRTDHDVAGDAGLAGLATGNYIYCPSLCYRRSVVGQRPFDDRWRFVVDLAYVSDLLLAGHRLRSIRQPLYEYRRHKGNETKAMTDDASRFGEELALSRRIATQARALGWRRTESAARRRWLVRGHLLLQTAADLARLRFSAARTKASLLAADLRPRRRSQPPPG